MKKFLSVFILFMFSINVNATQACNDNLKFNHYTACYMSKYLNAENEAKTKFITLMNKDSSTYEVQQVLLREQSAFSRSIKDQPYMCQRNQKDTNKCLYELVSKRIAILDEQLKNSN